MKEAATSLEKAAPPPPQTPRVMYTLSKGLRTAQRQMPSQPWGSL